MNHKNIENVKVSFESGLMQASTSLEYTLVEGEKKVPHKKTAYITLREIYDSEKIDAFWELAEQASMFAKKIGQKPMSLKFFRDATEITKAMNEAKGNPKASAEIEGCTTWLRINGKKGIMQEFGELEPEHYDEETGCCHFGTFQKRPVREEVLEKYAIDEEEYDTIADALRENLSGRICEECRFF